MIYLSISSIRNNINKNIWEDVVFSSCFTMEYILEGYNIDLLDNTNTINKINYLLDQNYLSFVPNQGDNFNHLDMFFEGEYVLIYEFLGKLKAVGASVAKKINNDKTKRIVGAVGKGLHTAREKINSIPGAGKINSSGAGVLTYKAGEHIKANVKNVVKHPVSHTALSVMRATEPLAHIETAKVLGKVDPKLHKSIHNVYSAASSALNTDEGRKAVKTSIKHSLKFSGKEPVAATKIMKKGATTAIKKGWDVTKSVGKFVKKHPVEAAAHVASQAAMIPMGMAPTSRSAAYMGVHSAGEYARHNKGHITKSLKRDTKKGVIKAKKGVIKAKKGVRYLTRQQPIDKLPSGMLSMAGSKSIIHSYKDFDPKHRMSKKAYQNVVQKAEKRRNYIKAKRYTNKQPVHTAA